MNKKIQVIRALSIMAVVLIHTNGDGIIAVINRPFINFAVAMFTFLSGYLTKTEIGDIKNFYKKRILKVLVPYIIWTVVYGIISQAGVTGILKNLLTATASGPFYYIFVYIQLVLLTPVIGKLLKSKYIHLGWAITPLYVIIIRYICKFAGVTLESPLPSVLCLAWLIYYYLGMALGNGIIRFEWKWKKTCFIYLLVIAISLLEGGLWYWIAKDFDMATTQIRITSIGTSTVACLLAYRFIVDNNVNLRENRLTKLLISMGDRSFGIFFSHMAVVAVVGKAFSIIEAGTLWVFPIKTVIVIALSFLFALVGNKILKTKSWIFGL